MSTDAPTPEGYDAERAAALDLIQVWESIGFGLGERASAASRCAQEATELPSVVDRPAVVTRTIADDGAMYVTTAVQQLRALVRLIGPDLVLNGWTVTRTLVEHASRVVWLLDPDVAPTIRLARWYMERIVSIYMAESAEEAIGDTSSAEKWRLKREATLEEARRAFPDLEMFKKRNHNSWSVGGEQYSSLSGAVRLLGAQEPGMHGLYDLLSSFTHPSIYRLRGQLRSVPQGDHRLNVFVVEPDVVRRQFKVSCSAAHRAALLVLDYLALSRKPLDEWAYRHPDLLRTPEHEGDRDSV